MALTFEFERQRRADRLTFLPDDEQKRLPLRVGASMRAPAATGWIRRVEERTLCMGIS
ncbi:hypothetical protein GALL_309120 [mine drainage metagenome]|uniref:Uncharacterized protein n=1 Tax=mine drainage metagenome TaxID=410659 RepID=A0A1J5QUR0_9ZZZZ